MATLSLIANWQQTLQARATQQANGRRESAIWKNCSFETPGCVMQEVLKGNLARPQGLLGSLRIGYFIRIYIQNTLKPRLYGSKNPESLPVRERFPHLPSRRRKETPAGCSTSRSTMSKNALSCANISTRCPALSVSSASSFTAAAVLSASPMMPHSCTHVPMSDTGSQVTCHRCSEWHAVGN